MLNKFLAGAVALALIAGIAHAASDQAAAPAQQAGQDQNAQGQDDSNRGWWGHGHGHGMHHGMGQGQMGGHGMMGAPGMMGGPGMMMGKAGFRMQLSPTVSVGIMCGQQALKDCIADAQPLIDAAKAAATAQPK